MPVIRATDARRTETPAAVMTTLVSPSQGESAQALWRVEAAPGTAGPVHVITRDQVWTFLTGAAVVDIAGEKVELAAGDTLVIPADVPRQMTPDADTGFTAICMGSAESRAGAPGGDTIPLPWAQ
ncbi:cupin domain-containing protein [Yinghuangia seranimata]|uniref:cupin domain-containing protein n=1 Tax=Yinghuangia seranimata TaxID=408067 RepID=UPI00248B48AC|nr:cupin domain-containing protein [Yinghuangia seranimata]MDI2132839.1 cupin domain-containing protein [Yinghuangia seranimata]